LAAMIFSLSLPRGIRRPCACVRPLGCGFLRPGKAGPETPEDGSGAEVAASWSPTSRCLPNRRRFARHDRRLRLGGEAGVAGPGVRPKPRATEGVTQTLVPVIRGVRERYGRQGNRLAATEGLPFRGSAVTSHHHDCAGRPQLVADAGEACATKGAVLWPPRSTPGSSHQTSGRSTLNSNAMRNPASVFGTCLQGRGRPPNASGRAKWQRRSVTDPIAGNRGLSGRGHAAGAPL